jgi:hypothetical protein
MKISIYTQIFPRLETFFLEEWIIHHLRLGVDKIFVYDNGMLSVNRQDTKNNVYEVLHTSRIWFKKPDADYFFDYSDEEIYKELYGIIKRFEGSVELIKWRTSLECSGSRRKECQYMGYSHCTKNNHSDWWIHIDPDEYLVSKQYSSIKEFVSSYELRNIFSLQLNQRVFSLRRREKQTNQIVEWAYDANIYKTIVKSPKLPKTINSEFIHITPSTLSSSKFKITQDEFRINHYRGFTRGAQHRKYIKENPEFNKVDKSLSLQEYVFKL